MKLVFILAAVLALSLAEEEKKDIEEIEDSEAAAASSIEILKEGVDLNTSASAYNYVLPSQRPPQWQVPQNTYVPPKQPENNYAPPANVQNDYYWSTGNNNAPHYRPTTTTTTTPVPVIKNEQYIGDNGNYHYEYQIGDGTHVGEQGWFSSPNKEEDSIVKKGWYSFVGADGVTYTVTYWADKTGYHAYGSHLPTPPPAAQPVNEQKPQNVYPTQTVAPQPIQTTPKPTYAPTQQPIYYPTQQPTYNPHQPTYRPPQQPTYNPPQQPTYRPPQQPTYNPPQQYYPPQQTYYPQQQQTYYPQQQQTYVPQYNV